MLCDLIAGAILGIATSSVYLRLQQGVWAPFSSDGPLWREAILGSIIAALVLREPRMVSDAGFPASGLWLASVLRRAATALIILLSVGLATRALNDMARLWVVGWAASFALWIVISRGLQNTYLRRRIARGELRETVAVLGSAGAAETVAARMAPTADIVLVINRLTSLPEHGADGPLDELHDLVNAGAIDTVVVAMESHSSIDIATVLAQLQSVPIQITLCTDIADSPAPGAPLRTIGDVPMQIISDRPLHRWDLVLKAFIDKVGACLLLLLLSPLLLAICVLILWDSPGPVIFSQIRSGWGGATFTVYKFRTMSHRAAPAGSLFQTRRNDPRITRVGAFLRRSSFDELPQLWNVLRGEMSLVGPRPHAEHLHENERTGCRLVAEYAQRQRMKPGMTGWAQVNGLRGAITSGEQLRKRVTLDLYYIENWSIWLDLRILVTTPLALLTTDNAF